MCLDVFLEILWTLEGLAAEFAAMRFQWNMDADVGCNVVAFDDLDATCSPCALQVEVVGAFTTDVAIADVILLFCGQSPMFTTDRYRRTYSCSALLARVLQPCHWQTKLSWPPDGGGATC